MNFVDTVEGSMLEYFSPAGWDLEKKDRSGFISTLPGKPFLLKELAWPLVAEVY